MGNTEPEKYIINGNLRTDMPSEIYPNHLHNHYELLYFLDGNVEYTIRSNTYLLEKGNLLLITPRSFHSAKLLSMHKYERIIFNFYEEAIPAEVAEFYRTAPSIFSIPEEHPISALLRVYADSAKILSPQEFKLLSIHTLQSILLLLKYFQPDSKIAPIQKNKKLRPILHYINENPYEKHTAQSLSKRFFVSTSWLAHTFHDELGVGLMQFTIKNRILYAQTQISAGKLPSNVAIECGYENYSTFFLQYKKVLGHSPIKDFNQALNIEEATKATDGKG